MAFGYVSSMLNWAFCTIVTPILAMQLAKRVKGLHFPMIGARRLLLYDLGSALDHPQHCIQTLRQKAATMLKS